MRVSQSWSTMSLIIILFIHSISNHSRQSATIIDMHSNLESWRRIVFKLSLNLKRGHESCVFTSLKMQKNESFNSFFYAWLVLLPFIKKVNHIRKERQTIDPQISKNIFFKGYNYFVHSFLVWIFVQLLFQGLL